MQHLHSSSKGFTKFANPFTLNMEFGWSKDMFQMNCTHCDGLIESPRLAEVQLFLCPQCEEIVVVENVTIAKEKSSINLRSSLRKLLISARDKFRINKADNSDIQAKYVIDKRLAKLLKRDDFRLDLSHDFFVQVGFDGQKRSAKLLNISSTGAAIEFFEMGEFPGDDSETTFQLPLPGQKDPLSILARVVWRGKPAKDTISPTITMGLQFREIDEEIRASLWEFIVNSETSART
jgi:hypothetical protein